MVIWKEGRKEGKVLFNDALNTFLFTVMWHRTYGKGRKEMFYLMTHSTHFIYGYIRGVNLGQLISVRS